MGLREAKKERLRQEIVQTALETLAATPPSNQPVDRRQVIGGDQDLCQLCRLDVRADLPSFLADFKQLREKAVHVVRSLFEYSTRMEEVGARV